MSECESEGGGLLDELIQLLNKTVSAAKVDDAAKHQRDEEAAVATCRLAKETLSEDAESSYTKKERRQR